MSVAAASSMARRQSYPGNSLSLYHIQIQDKRYLDQRILSFGTFFVLFPRISTKIQSVTMSSSSIIM